MGARFPFASYPRGWFAVALAGDVAAGAVTTVHHFGQDIVLFRGASGGLAAVDHACPHLGAHLGVGWVEDDCLRCPVHAWGFDGAGRCIDIPGVSRIPAKAAVAAWPLREAAGVALVYHCPDGEAPTWEPPGEAGVWTLDRARRWQVASHPQEVAEWLIDGVHRRAGVDPEIVEARHALRLVWRAAGGESTVTLHGLGVALVTHTTGAGAELRRIYTTPISAERVAVFGSHCATDEALAAEGFLAFTAEVARDLPILATKAYLDQPTLLAGDGPIARFRRWARQFYATTTARPETASREQRGAQVRLGEWLRRTDASSQPAESDAGPSPEDETSATPTQEDPPDRVVH